MKFTVYLNEVSYARITSVARLIQPFHDEFKHMVNLISPRILLLGRLKRTVCFGEKGSTGNTCKHHLRRKY